MFDGIAWADLTGYGVITLIAVLVITRRLVWHTDLRDAKVERDWWRDMALRSMGVSEKMTVHAEVASEVLAAIPVPDLTERGDGP